MSSGNHQRPLSSASSMSDATAAASVDEAVLRVVDEAHVFASLMPLLLAHLGPVAAKDARASVQVLTMIQVSLRCLFCIPIFGLTNHILRRCLQRCSRGIGNMAT